MTEGALEVKKHVGIIHCSNKLTLLQRKLSNALLYCAYDNLLVHETHEIRIGELTKLVGYSSHDYDSVKKALKSLMIIVLEWNLLKSNTNKSKNEKHQPALNLDKIANTDDSDHKQYSWHASTLLSSASIDGSICRYSYSPELRSLLYMPEIYGRINLLVQSRFKSTYALALYENCIRYKNLQHTGWISLEVFRKLMGVVDEKYKKYKDFKRRVLDKAVQEVNEVSDISVDVELQQQRQKTIALRFKLSKNTMFNSSETTVSSVIINGEGDKNKHDHEKRGTNDVQNILREEFSVSQKKIDSLLLHHDQTYIEEKINVVKSSASYKEGKIKNITAYFLSALKDDFQPKADDSAKRDIEISTLKREEKAKELLEESYRKYVNETIKEDLQKIEIETRQEIDEGFRKKIFSNNISFIVKRYKESGITDPIVQSLYFDYVKQEYSELVTTIKFEEFAKTYRQT